MRGPLEAPPPPKPPPPATGTLSRLGDRRGGGDLWGPWARLPPPGVARFKFVVDGAWPLPTAEYLRPALQRALAALLQGAPAAAAAFRERARALLTPEHLGAHQAKHDELLSRIGGLREAAEDALRGRV